MKAEKTEPVKIFGLKHLDILIQKYYNNILPMDTQLLSTVCWIGVPSSIEWLLQLSKINWA